MLLLETEVKGHLTTSANAYADLFYLEEMTQQSIQANEEQCGKGFASEENQRALTAENLPDIFRKREATGSACSHVPVVT